MELETKQHRRYEDGEMNAVRWHCDGIELGHAVLSNTSHPTLQR